MIRQSTTELTAPLGPKGGRASPQWLRGFGNAVLDLLFPASCVGCHRYGAWLCADCLADIEVIKPPVCGRCGIPLGISSALPGAPVSRMGAARGTSPVCGTCRGVDPLLDGVRAFAFHSGPLRQAVHCFKYQDLRALAAPLGALMARGWQALAGDEVELDLIVPIPLHRARLRERGYNQAALLARELGARIGVPVAEGVLARTRATVPQVGLSAEERRANVQGAFQSAAGTLAGRRALLVDDVYTTGSTLESACAALRKSGAVSVWAYTLVRAR